MSPPKVFISYAREDARVAFRLSESLKGAGLETWFDQERILPGQKWGEETRRAIRSSDFFLAVLSSRSLNKRGFVQKELKQALEILDEFPESDVFIIPVRIDDCSIDHEKLAAIHWVNMFPAWQVGIELILKTIQHSSRLPPASPLVPSNSQLLPRSSFGSIPHENILRDILETDIISSRNYRNSFLASLAIFIPCLFFIFILVSRYDVNEKEYAWEIPAASLLYLLNFGAFYLFVRGLIRWFRSYRLRRTIVNSNEVVASLLRSRNPIIFRLLLGSWAWSGLHAALLAILILFQLLFILIFLITLFDTTQSTYGPSFSMLSIAAAPALISFLTLRTLSKTWKYFQSRAGVPGFSNRD